MSLVVCPLPLVFLRVMGHLQKILRAQISIQFYTV